MSTSVNVSMSSFFNMNAYTPTTNYSSGNTFYVGENNSSTGRVQRTGIKPNFSGIPAGQKFLSAVLKVTPIQDLTSTARTLYVGRILRNVVAAEVTWNIFSTGNNWGSGGCSDSSTDYDGAVILGSASVSDAPTLNTAIEITLNASELQKLYDGTYTNNGLILFVDTQLNDAVGYASPDHATTNYRPVISIEYEKLSSGVAVVDISGYGIF